MRAAMLVELFSGVISLLFQWGVVLASPTLPPRAAHGNAGYRRLAVGQTELLPQVGEHREHAPVILLVRRQAELHEDARDVLLDRTKRDDEALGDRLVGAALRHQLEHLALARRELRHRVLAAAAAHQPSDDLRVERR